MAEIPVSTIVNVTITTAPTFPSRQGFGTLNIVGISPVIGAQERARIYNNADGVAVDFDSSTEERKAADVYFSQTPKPVQLVISRRFNVAVAAQIRSGGNPETDIGVWKAITDGRLNINIDSTLAETADVDFSSVTTLADVAAAMQTALQAVHTGATVEYRESEGRFYVTSGTTGAGSTIQFPVPPSAGTDVTTQFALGLGDATKADGLAAESLTDALDAIQDKNQDWYGVCVTKEIRDSETEILEVAAWVEARVKVFTNDTDDRDVIDAANPNDIATKLKAKNYRRSMTCFNYVPGEYLAVSAVGRAFTVNFSAPNSTITLMFKQMPGLTTSPLSQSEFSALKSKNANALVSIGGNVMFAEGKMANGTFFDEVHGVDWLQNAIETNVFGKLYTDTTKTAMTDPGTASLQQKVEEALAEATFNGLGAPGYDSNDVFLPKGYLTSVVPMRNHNQSDKEARIAPPISFTLLGAGAIHGVSVVGTFER